MSKSSGLRGYLMAGGCRAFGVRACRTLRLKSIQIASTLGSMKSILGIYGLQIVLWGLKSLSSAYFGLFSVSESSLAVLVCYVNNS